MNAQKLGITFSNRHAQQLGLPIAASLKQATRFGFSHIRLGAYWSDLEVAPGVFKWKSLIQQLEICERAQQPVVLVIGAKAPRWPEYYIPEWYDQYFVESEQFAQHLLTYLEKLLARVKSFSCITHWQVENEPFMPITVNEKKLTIPEALLEREVKLVRSLDNRPVIVSAFGNHGGFDGSLQRVALHADVLGVDLYPKIFTTQLFGKSFYTGVVARSLLVWQLHKVHKPIWLTELQAEPWEKNESGYTSEHPKSISVQQLENNLQFAQSLPVMKTLLWGFEYWLWRQQHHGDDRYMQLVKRWL